MSLMNFADPFITGQLDMVCKRDKIEFDRPTLRQLSRPRRDSQITGPNFSKTPNNQFSTRNFQSKNKISGHENIR